MNQKKIWFVVVTYKPEKEVLQQLMAALEGWPVEVIDNTDKNLGFGGGANVGMRKAFDAGTAWAVVCNQDVTLSKQGVAKFVKALEHCEPGIVGPEAGTLDSKRWTTILPGNKKIDYISGSMMAIHKNVWEKIGGFYEPYFMYYEDVDLCVRAKALGFPLRQVDIEGFRHASYGNEYYLARNHLLFVYRNAPVSVKFHEILRLPKTIWESLW